MSQPQIEVGTRVDVFENPITRHGFIGTARVTKILERENYSDANGNPMVRVRAIRLGEKHADDWWVSTITQEKS